jgi:hypothetical protein
MNHDQGFGHAGRPQDANLPADHDDGGHRFVATTTNISPREIGRRWPSAAIRAI